MCSWPHSEKVQVEKCKDYKLSRGSIQIPPVLDSNSESTLVNVEGTTNKKVSRPSRSIVGCPGRPLGNLLVQVIVGGLMAAGRICWAPTAQMKYFSVS